MLLRPCSRCRLRAEGYHHDLKLACTDVFSESTFGEKAAAALSKIQPPNYNSAATISDYRPSRHKWHAGWHFYAANNHKDFSLPSSGSTVLPKGCWPTTASHHPAWNKHDLTDRCTAFPPESLPSPSQLPRTWKICIPQVSTCEKKKEPKPKIDQSPATSGWILQWLGNEASYSSVIYHLKFSLPVCYTPRAVQSSTYSVLTQTSL